MSWELFWNSVHAALFYSGVILMSSFILAGVGFVVYILWLIFYDLGVAAGHAFSDRLKKKKSLK